MTDRNALTDQNETPEDVASLYSWANLHGAKYRDFSASRAQTREKARQRVQAAIDEERTRSRRESEAQQIAEAQRAAEAQRSAEAAHQAELAAQRAAQQAELSAQQAAQRAAEQAAHQAEMAAQQAARQAAQQAEMAARQAAQEAEWAAQQVAEQRPWQPAHPEQPAWADSYSAYSTPQQAAEPAAPNYAQPPQPRQDPAFTSYAQHRAFADPFRPAANPPANQSAFTPMREEGYTPRGQWPVAESRETPVRPAWLSADRAEVSSRAVPKAPEDTLQGSRDRLISRWFALQGVFDGSSAPVEAQPAPAASRAPVMAVFSLAGGVGKTSIVASLGRALSSRGERVLLVDTTAFGLLPFFFGARDQRPGVLRTFSPPPASGDAAIQMVTLDPEAMGPETNGQESLSAEIQKNARGASRVIVDLGTASGATTRRVMRMSPIILVPVIPDMNSVVSVGSIDSFFEHNSPMGGKAALPHYVLNQFDPSLPLHLDIREVLREQLGDRLLPFALRRTPAVSEALAEGMTVMDYAPNSPLAEDMGSLAGWVKSLSAPASTGFRGVRWSER